MAALKTSIQNRGDDNPVASAFENLANLDVVHATGRPTISEWQLVDIPLSALKSFPRNRLLRLSKIEALAASIHGTRLINPIAVAKDSDGQYIILSGHRRFEAYKLLNEQYPEGKYAKISGYIVSSRDSDDPSYLKKIWFDANFEVRQLSLEDAVNNIEMFLKGIDKMSGIEKRVAINELKGVEPDADDLKKLRGNAAKLNKARFIYEQFKSLDIPGWSQSNIQRYIVVVDKAIPEVKEDFLRSELPLYVAYDISQYPTRFQKALLTLFQQNPTGYFTDKVTIIGKKSPNKKSPFTREAKTLQTFVNNIQRLVSYAHRHPDDIDDETIASIKLIRNHIKELSTELDNELKLIESQKQ